MTSFELDGIRCVKLDEKVASRKLKQAEYHRGWYRRNKERVLENKRKWRKANPDAERLSSARRRVKNPEKARAIGRSWRLRNREKDTAASRAGYLRRKYGLSLERYKQLFLQQGGSCAICVEKLILFGRGRKSAHLDHSHASGKVRAFLCGACNKALGLVKESKQVLSRMIDYLETYS